jgi:hypothetical protein
MVAARLSLVLPDDPELVARIEAALASQGDPPITVGRSRTAVLALEAATADLMLRSRVVQALETAVGPEWQRLVLAIE